MASTNAQDLGYTTPHQARSLRACMVCSIVQLQSVRLTLLHHPHHHHHLPPIKANGPFSSPIVEIPLTRLSQLRAHPHARQQPRRHRRMHICKLQRRNSSHEARGQLGCKMAADRDICAWHLCRTGAGTAAGRYCGRVGGCGCALRAARR